MSPGAKGTAAAAGAAIAIVDIAAWIVHLKWGLDIPPDIATDFSGLLTLLLGFVVHNGAS